MCLEFFNITLYTVLSYSLSSLNFSISTITLRPIKKNSEASDKANKVDSPSFLSRVRNVSSILIKWSHNKIFLLICVSKGRPNAYSCNNKNMISHSPNITI